MNRIKVSMLTLVLLVLASCGNNDTMSIPVTSVQRGSVIGTADLVPLAVPGVPTVNKLDPGLFSTIIDSALPGFSQIAGAPKCSITSYHIKYRTVGGKGEATDASAAIMVPSGTDAVCSGARPVLLYAHGTAFDKTRNMANLLAEDGESTLIAATFAAQGFIVVAPNYAGYDTSSLSYHPYLNAEQQANDMIDSLRAARKAFAGIKAQVSDKLFLSGYSQGGHVAMATQRAMQTLYQSEFKVTALAAMSGPYAVVTFADIIFSGSPNLYSTGFFPLLSTSWQKSYGNVYTTPGDFYEAPYASGIETVLPSTLTFTQIFSQGHLPLYDLFAQNSLPGPSSPQFAPFFGNGNLVKSNARTIYLNDVAANPCGNDPAKPLSCAPQSGIRVDAYKNDLRTYVPNVPVFMCGGSADPVVFYKNTTATAAYFTANGLPVAALAVLDVDSPVTGLSDPFAAIKAGFAVAKGSVAAAAGSNPADQANAVEQNYHAPLVYSACTVAARGYFQSLLAQ